MTSTEWMPINASQQTCSNCATVRAIPEDCIEEHVGCGVGDMTDHKWHNCAPYEKQGDYRSIEPRAVFLVYEGGDIPAVWLCSPCIEDTYKPEQTKGDIVGRDDSAHCIGCDYHHNEDRATCPLWQTDDVAWVGDWA